MKFLVKKNNLEALRDRLGYIKREVAAFGDRWVLLSAHYLDDTIRQHLATQGRGGAPPPLTQLTKFIYSIDGPPDGSGIRNHLNLFFEKGEGRSLAGIGITPGRPTTTARIQDRGAVIPLTPGLRGFFAARYGIVFSQSKQFLVVPGRRFWSDSNEKARNEAERSLRAFFLDLLG
jgi:hypothetical protein